METQSVPQEEEYTLEEYRKWWANSVELHEYLDGMPPEMAERVRMGKPRLDLIESWLDLQPPDSLDEVDEDTAADLLGWIRKAETLIHFVVYRPEAATEPEVQKPKFKKLALVDDISEISGENPQWHWPWIEGWDNPAKREKILNPPKEGSTVKKVLMIGAAAGVAIYVGKRMLSDG